jgi:hypothetical protein
LSIGQRLKAKTQRATTFTSGITKRRDHNGAWPVRLRIRKMGMRRMMIQKKRAKRNPALRKACRS